MNWVAKPNLSLLVKGQLPEVKVPTSAEERKYCQVSVMDGAAVESHFCVRCVMTCHCGVSLWSVTSVSGV